MMRIRSDERLEGALSPDDVPALLGFVVAAALLITSRVRRMFLLTPLAWSRDAFLGLVAAFSGCSLTLWLALRIYAARGVRESFGYQLMFVAAGMVAIDVASRGLALVGIDVESDGCERNNAAARIACVGMWVAITICAIGANLGEGDEISTTLVPLALGVAGLLIVALIVSLGTGGFAAVTLERSRAAGVRAAAMFVAASSLLARAASGDWVSTEATLRDFGATARWLVLIAGLAIVAEIGFARARRQGLRESLWLGGVMLGVLYFAVTAALWRSAL